MKLLPVKTALTTSPAAAAEFIKRGGIVAFPTETVYGLGANIFDEDAVEQIFEAKQRPADNPLIAHIGGLDQIAELAAEVPSSARLFIDAFFPGPLTLVLNKSARVPLIATAGLETIGVRMPGNSVANEFLKECGVSVAAPSANISGRPSPTTWEAVFEDLNGRIDCILQGEATQIGLESTVVDCTGDVPILLRPGAVSLDALRTVVASTRLRDAADDQANKSPGLRHKHYAPNARVVIVREHDPTDPAEQPFESGGYDAFIGLEKPSYEFELVKICASAKEYAHEMFNFFRECDKRGIRTIYCQPVDETGIGTALMDRLRRAAAG